MMEIYIASVEPLAAEQIFLEQMKKVPEERQRRALRCRQREDGMRILGAGLLLEYVLEHRGLTLLDSVDGRRKVGLAEGTHGKPYIRDDGGIHFNLSHSGKYAAIVVSDAEVGIDIERIRRAGMAVAHRFFQKEESAFLEAVSQSEADRRFTELWTRKESYIKAAGEGMSLPLTAFSVLEEQVGGDDRYALRTWDEPEGYCLSVCGRMEGKPEIVRADMKSI